VIEIIATVSSKNQVTLPADVRRRLGIRASDKIAFVLGEENSVVLRPVRFDLESILGSLEPLPNETLDLEREIGEAVAEAYERRSRRRQ
jgi:antitoxin PrlF